MEPNSFSGAPAEERNREAGRSIYLDSLKTSHTIRLLKLVHSDSSVGDKPDSTTSAGSPGGKDDSALNYHHQQNGFSLTMIDVEIEKAPKYWALSYTWGQPQFPETEEEAARLAKQAPVMQSILCNGVVLEIGQNLFDFFCQARDSKLFTLPHSRVEENWFIPKITHDYVADVLEPGGDHGTYLWVDAICINQADTGERSHQVHLMGNIYQGAQKVVVWLGPSEPSAGVAWICDEFALQLTELDAKCDFVAFSDSSYLLDDPWLINHIGAESCKRWRDSCTEFINFFAAMRWFMRGWVIQEVFLKGDEQVVLLCGSKTFSWRLYIQLLNIICNHWLDLIYDVVQLHAKWWTYPDILWMTLALIPRKLLSSTWHNRDRQEYHWGDLNAETGRFGQVWDLVDTIRAYEFSDPRDHIYGCLGLVRSILAPQFDLTFETDYNIAPERVFTEFTGLVLGKLAHLDVLERAGGESKRLANLPSWVPDFTADTTRSRHLRTNAKDHFIVGEFNASLAALPDKHYVRIRGSELTLAGAQLDSVVERERGNRTVWFLRYLTGGFQHQPTSQASAEALYAAVTAGAKLTIMPREGYQASVRYWFLLFFSSDVKRVSTYVVEDGTRDKIATLLEKAHGLGPSVGEWLPTWAEVSSCATKPQEGLTYAIDSLYNTTSSMWMGRRLFLTAGGLIGLGPEHLEPGDGVWVIQGARILFTLRQCSQGDRYNLIGGTYLHGVMHGEAMTEELKSRIGTVTII